MNTRHITMLKELDAHITPHSRRTLLEHLQGTYKLLMEWGNDPIICVAGLFHSIYGTYTFEKKSADLSMRDRIRAVIGPESERLVHLFCVTDRSSFYELPVDSRFCLRDTTNDNILDLDRDSLAALIEIEVANVVEAVPRRSKKKALDAAEWYGGAFARSQDYISKPAARAAERCFDAVLNQRPQLGLKPPTLRRVGD